MHPALTLPVGSFKANPAAMHEPDARVLFKRLGNDREIPILLPELRHMIKPGNQKPLGK